MFFLLRMTFWISLVLVLLPSGGKHSAAVPSTDAGAREAVSAASATVSDMRQFCTRQPTACALGSQAAIAFGQRAQAGAKRIYDFISERTAPHDSSSVASKSTKPAPSSSAKSSQDTLTAADVAPNWRGPHREVHNKHGA